MCPDGARRPEAADKIEFVCALRNALFETCQKLPRLIVARPARTGRSIRRFNIGCERICRRRTQSRCTSRLQRSVRILQRRLRRAACGEADACNGARRKV